MLGFILLYAFSFIFVNASSNSTFNFQIFPEPVVNTNPNGGGGGGGQIINVIIPPNAPPETVPASEDSDGVKDGEDQKSETVKEVTPIYRVLESIKKQFNNLIGKSAQKEEDGDLGKEEVVPEENNKALFDIISSPGTTETENKFTSVATVLLAEFLVLLLIIYLWRRFRR